MLTMIPTSCELVSRSQTTFSSFIFGREEKGSGERPISFLFTFWGFYERLLIGVKGQKRLVDR